MSDIITVGGDFTPKTTYEFKKDDSELTLRKMDLLPEDHPVLHKEPLTWIFDPPQADPKLMYEIMLENMVYHHGLGLSANQIGMPVKVFAMRIDESDNAIVCFNPEIVKESEEMIKMTEGCLSFPSLYLNKRRPKEVSVKYQNADGDFITAHFEGLAARVFHHEMDHMMGKTFLDGVSKILLQSARRNQKTLIRKVKKDGRRTPY
jgi:peptide deformylase